MIYKWATYLFSFSFSNRWSMINITGLFWVTSACFNLDKLHHSFIDILQWYKIIYSSSIYCFKPFIFTYHGCKLAFSYIPHNIEGYILGFSLMSQS